MTELLVNGVYPLQYFALDGVDPIQYPDQFWWSSKQRFAAEDPLDPTRYLSVTEGGNATVEYLEIDLGRVREINYINFDTLRVPVDIQVEYDQVSGIDGVHSWVPVVRRDDMPYSERISYDANNRSAWFAAEFYFSDPKGYMVHTRYIRIRFARRDEEWPVRGATPFRWPIMVKHMRSGVYIAKELDTVGQVLAEQHVSGGDDPASFTATLPLDTSNATREIRQRFQIPVSAARAQSLVPDILGFGVLIQSNSSADTAVEAGSDLGEHAWEWSLWNVDTSTKLGGGVEYGVPVRGDRVWLDFYLPEGVVIETDTTSVYEFRFRSLNPVRSDTVWLVSPSDLSLRTLSGTLTFTNGSSTVTTTANLTNELVPGDLIQKTDDHSQVFTVNTVTPGTITLTTNYTGVTTATATAAVINPLYKWDGTTGQYVKQSGSSLVMRVWGNVGSAGRDVLGNSYRYGVRRDKAAYVFDGTRAGWMSEPRPTPNAVEALYFDVRQDSLDENGQPVKSLALLDALKIAPRTPGVTMHIYYSQQNLQGDTPVTREDWDNLVWTPINQTYILRQNLTLELPHPVKTAYIKLEFTNLRPLPFKVPNYPKLPPQEYRRYPTWVEQQFDNSTLRKTVEDWFFVNSTPIQQKVLSLLTDPVAEFQYKQREFLASLSLSSQARQSAVNAGLLDSTNSFVDPVTASRIFISTPDQYRNTLILNVDKTSVLGQIVTDRFDTRLENDSVESAAPPFVSGGVPAVSSATDRVSESYSFLAQQPMNFNQRSRHVYKIESAEFNKKAYFVGIDEIAFLRLNYTTKHDDTIISDILYDDDFLVENTWDREDVTMIPDGANLYVSYDVGDQHYDNEIVHFASYTGAPLQNRGRAENVKVFSLPNGQGVQFFLSWDYDLLYETNSQGVVQTKIARTNLSERLTAPKQNIVYRDVGTVTAHALIPSPPRDDAAVVTSVAVPINTYDGILRNSAATITSVAAVSAAESKGNFDGQTVTATAVATSANTFNPADATPVVSVAVPSSTQTFAAADSGTVTGTAQVSAFTAGLVGQGVVGRSGTTVADLRLATTDSSVVGSVAAPSATDTKTP